MKTGKTLTQLAQTLEDIRENSRDFLVPTSKLKMNNSANLEFENGSVHQLTPNSHSAGQIAGYAGVPKSYFDRLAAENKPLLADNVNHGFQKQQEEQGRGGKPETRMIRSYRDNIRAMLSSSYRRLDSYDLCREVLPLLADNNLEVVSSEITDTRMYLKALMPSLKTEVKKGDVVQYGIVISNSDVGAGSVRVEPLIFRLVCANGLISNTAIRKFHVGKNMAGDDVTELLTQETLNLTDQAFWAQVKDIVSASMKHDAFDFEVNRIRAALDQPIKNFNIPDVVELAMKQVRVSGEAIKNDIVAYLANGADGAGLNKWGLANGFTYAAQSDALNYDQSIELERVGSKIIELPYNQWKRIAETA